MALRYYQRWNSCHIHCGKNTVNHTAAQTSLPHLHVNGQAIFFLFTYLQYLWDILTCDISSSLDLTSVNKAHLNSPVVTGWRHRSIRCAVIDLFNRNQSPGFQVRVHWMLMEKWDRCMKEVFLWFPLFYWHRRLMPTCFTVEIIFSYKKMTF